MDVPTIYDYRISKLETTVTRDIIERWETRIVANNFHTDGRFGCDSYIERFGQRIGAPKCIKFAIYAETAGYQEFAAGMWVKAYQIETGTPNPHVDYNIMYPRDVSPPVIHTTLAYPPDDGPSVPVDDVVIFTTDNTGEPVTDDGPPGPVVGSPIDNDPVVLTVDVAKDDVVVAVPLKLNPGATAVLEPENIREEISYYFENEIFWAQPKIDGIRLLAYAFPNITFQARSLALHTAPSREIRLALEQLYNAYGLWILDGELYYEDSAGGEHRTGAQAEYANGLIANTGAGEFWPVKIRYAIFDCLMAKGIDLTNLSYLERITHANEASEFLSEQAGADDFMTSHSFRYVETARTQKEKETLFNRQERLGREGIIFRNCTSKYIPGKHGTTFRSKFLTEHVLEVIGLTDSTVQDRPFAAIVTRIGKVGTGFTLDQQREIAEAFANQSPLMVKIVSQGLTERGRLWHPRYVGIAEN